MNMKSIFSLSISPLNCQESPQLPSVFTCFYVGWLLKMKRPPVTDNNRTRFRFVVATVHVLSWLVFLSLPAIFNPRRQGEGFFGLFRDLTEPPRWTNGLLLIIVFYFNYFYAIPRLYFRRRYALFVTTAAAAFGAFVAINYLQRPAFEPGGPRFSPLGNSFNLFMFLIVYLAAFLICLSDLWRRIREQHWQRKMHVVTGRINPHMLFNTLNSIYALSLAKPETVPQTIVKLSQALRYSMDESGATASLQHEIDFLQNYVDLEKLRLAPDLFFSFEVEGPVPDISFPRFLLVPMVEGALKSMLADEHASDVALTIKCSDNELFMLVRGTAPSSAEVLSFFPATSLRAGLDLNFPGNYTLDLSVNDHIFVVALHIRLS